MPSLRLITWNCHHGALDSRLAELDGHAPDIVFLQEHLPAKARAVVGKTVVRLVGPRKGVAVAAVSGTYQLTRLRSRANCGRAVVAVAVNGPVSFTALGIWSQGAKYVDDVLRTLTAYAGLLRAGPAVVMGDLNSGTRLDGARASSRGHARITTALADLGLTSAYHAFHGVAHGHEAHPTYRHLFKASQPWHIDFCFVPANWVDRVVRVDVIDGEDWAVRSDHLPLMVDLRF